MLHSNFVIALVIVLLTATTCSKNQQSDSPTAATNSQEVGRKDLFDKRIKYPKEEFLERTKKGDRNGESSERSWGAFSPSRRLSARLR